MNGEGDRDTSAFIALEKIQFNESANVKLGLVKKFKSRCTEVNESEDTAICLDFLMMATELIACTDKKLKEQENAKV